MGNPTTATFTDPISREVCVLVVPSGGRIFPARGSNEPQIGVRHPRCGEVADLSLELDAFYCPTCRWNGRISGAWAFDVIDGAAGLGQLDEPEVIRLTAEQYNEGDYDGPFIEGQP